MFVRKHSSDEDREVSRHLLPDDEESDERVDDDLRNHGIFDIEDAMDKVGYGFVHYLVMGVCAWACTSDAVEVVCISFILPAAECDLHLTSIDKGLLNSIIFLGMMIGGFVWGAASDSFGRRPILITSLTLNGLAGFLSSLSPNFSVFLLLRLLSGVGVGGSYPVIFAYYTEWQLRNYRGAAVSALSCCWMMGGLLTAALAWAIVPHIHFVIFTTSEFSYSSWRLFLAVCTVPSLSSAVIFAFLPESTKYILQSGDEARATNYMNQLAIRYSVCTTSETMFSRVVLDKKADRSPAQPIGSRRSILTACKLVWSRLRHLFQLQYRSVVLTLIFVNFSLAFGYYGLLLWFPELFSRVERFGGSPCNLLNNANKSSNFSGPCDEDLLSSTTVYWESFLVNTANLPGNLLSILIIDKIGRRLLLSVSMLLTAISVFLVATVNNRVQFLLLSCTFAGLSASGWNALGVISTEVVPTSLRSTAIGFSQGLSRIAAILGNLVFGALVDTSCAIPLILASGFLILGGLASIRFPNTTRKNII